MAKLEVGPTQSDLNDRKKEQEVSQRSSKENVHISGGLLLLGNIMEFQVQIVLSHNDIPEGEGESILHALHSCGPNVL